jgi:Carboxypeptidase regulatory-like domain
MKRSFVLRTVLVTVIGTISFAASMLAQVANNTAVVGTVLDSSGSVLAGAKVTAVEESTGVAFPGTTNDQGYYAIKFIPPGTYDITVEQAGFAGRRNPGRNLRYQGGAGFTADGA